MSWHQILILNQSCIARSTTDRLCHCGDCVSLTRRTQGPGRLIATLFKLPVTDSLTSTDNEWHTTNDYLQFDWLIHWFNEMILVSKFIFISSWHCIQGDALWLWVLLLMQDCYCQCQSVAQTDSDWSSLLSMNENYLMMTIIILHSVHSVYFAISLFDWLELMPFWIWQLTAVPKKKIGSSMSGIQWHSFTGMMNQCMAGNHCRIMTHWTIRG